MARPRSEIGFSARPYRGLGAPNLALAAIENFRFELRINQGLDPIEHLLRISEGLDFIARDRNLIGFIEEAFPEIAFELVPLDIIEQRMANDTKIKLPQRNQRAGANMQSHWKPFG